MIKIKRRLNIFIDESGDFGFTEGSSELYAVSFTIHESDASIINDLEYLNNRLQKADYDGMIHLADLIARRGDYAHFDLKQRQNIFWSIFFFSKRVKVGRIVVNSPSSHGGIGDIYNTNLPSLTLGCGSFGKNSTTSNVSSVNLINVKRVAKRRVNMQWFKVPEKIYFEAGAISYLEKMPDITRAFIVTDEGMVKLRLCR